MRIAAIAVVALCGCFPTYRNLATSEDSDVIGIRNAAKKLRPTCDFKMAAIDTRDTDQAMRWRVTGCGEPVACRSGNDDEILCFEDPPRLGDYADARRQRAPLGAFFVAAAVQEISGCASDDTRVARTGEKLESEMTAINCGKTFLCTPTLDSIKREMTIIGAKCIETTASLARGAGASVVEYLELETGCPASSIVVVAATKGSAPAYRLAGCGKAYVCTTAAGRTECKAALDQAAVLPTLPANP